MLVAFDILLIMATAIILLAGISYRRSLWYQGAFESQMPRWRDTLSYWIHQKPIRRRPLAGAAHMAITWGVLLFLAITLITQLPVTLPETAAQVVSLLLDMLGAIMAAALLFFIFRHFYSKNTDENNDSGRKKMFSTVLLLCIVVSGFLAEGARIAVMQPAAAWASPVGWGVSMVTPPSPLFMQAMIRFHLVAVLLFFATLPFTFMRHAVTASINAAYTRKFPPGQMRPLALQEEQPELPPFPGFSWKQRLESDVCVTCDRCVQHCPASLSGKPLSPRKVVEAIVRHMETNDSGFPRESHPAGGGPEWLVSDDEIWACTTCLACVWQCPVFADPADKILSLRRHRVLMEGRIPREAAATLRNLELFGDGQGKGMSYRRYWAAGCRVPVLSESRPAADVLLWVGCSGAFHPRYSQTTRDMVKILRAADVDFAILGNDEFCCGDPARRLGGENLFQDLARKNIQRLGRYTFEKIVSLCPHCYNTLKNEYPAFGGCFEVLHASELIMNLVHAGRIVLKYPVVNSLTIHDPCYLGRANNIYEPLRHISCSLPDARLVEAERSRENGFCCGGGGGHMWLRETTGQHINHVRAAEMAGLQTDIVATACPYCLVMMEDGMGNLAAGTFTPRVRDIVELVAAAMPSSHDPGNGIGG